MPQLRYFGMDVGEGVVDSARADSRLGQFLAWAEPLPVGTEVEVDGVPHTISRVDEGLAPGVWLLAANQTLRDIPLHVEAEATTPSPPPVVVSDVPVPPAPPAPAPAAAEAAESGDAPSEPEPDGGGRRKRRKARKTVLGR